MNNLEKDLLENISSPEYQKFDAYNIRKNGQTIDRQINDKIKIESKKDKEGIDITVEENAIGIINIPVLITTRDIKETVYNDFYIGKGANVVIVAGCGIHSDDISSHKGIHRFFIQKNAKVKYVEKHYGSGACKQKDISPEVIIELEENAKMDVVTIQISGVDTSLRTTTANLQTNATLTVSEKIMTSNEESAKTEFNINFIGENASAHIVSRAVATNNSYQEFVSNVIGYTKCFGHVECDAIIKDKATIKAMPKIDARCMDANLIHEAAIGKIAGEQLMKLMTLGLNEKEAEAKIIEGFLK